MRLKFPKMFFGWWTVVAGGFLGAWATGYGVLGLSAFFKPIAAELGLSRTATSVASSLGRLEGGFEGLVVGWLTDRFGPKVVIMAGTALVGLGLILMNWVNSVWTFYLVWAGVVGTGVNIAVSTSMDKAISNWFIRKRGLALSIRWIIHGSNTVVVLPLIVWLITAYDWRMSSVTGGLVMLLVGLPLVWFMIKGERPEYYGLLPDGAAVETGLKKDRDQMIARGVEYAASFQEVEFTLRQAMRTLAFWLVLFSYVFFAATQQVILTHTIPLLTDMGISPIRAASIMAIAALASMPTRFFAGFMADRVKKEHLRFLFGGSFLVKSIAIVAFLLMPTLTMAYVFLILFYLAHGVALVVRSLVMARYFGRKGLGSIEGTSTMLIMPFSMIAPVYAGWVYDTTGNYLDAFKLLASLLAVSAAIMYFAKPPKPPAVVTDIHKFF